MKLSPSPLTSDLCLSCFLLSVPNLKKISRCKRSKYQNILTAKPQTDMKPKIRQTNCIELLNTIKALRIPTMTSNRNFKKFYKKQNRKEPKKKIHYKNSDKQKKKGPANIHNSAKNGRGNNPSDLSLEAKKKNRTCVDVTIANTCTVVRHNWTPLTLNRTGSF